MLEVQGDRNFVLGLPGKMQSAVMHLASQATAFCGLLCAMSRLERLPGSECRWVGCWMQVSFIFGYSMKLQSVVKTMGGVRALTLPFSTPLQNTLVHDLTVKVSNIRPPEMLSLAHSDHPIYAPAMYKSTYHNDLCAFHCM